jgi:glycerophosphoryl diester phosphodiesterase
MSTPPVLIAHRGFSSRHPEMTRAAYQAAIDWVYETEIPLGLECDVHFSADDELICLHDLTLDRTSTSSGPAYQRTVAELKQVDFGSRMVPDPEPEQRELVTLREQFGDRDQAPQRPGP